MTVNREPERPLRKGQFSDVPFVAQHIASAIDEAFGDTPALAEAEKRRYSAAYIRALIAADPAYVMMSVKDDGTPIGFMLAAPEQGVLLHSWGFVLPQHRNGAQAVNSARSFLKYWDNGTFHKAMTFTRPQNKAARIVLTRGGFKHTHTLEQHFFGQDALVYEAPLNKTAEGYAPPIHIGRLNDLKFRLRAWFS